MKAAWLYDSKIRRTSDPNDQPKRDPETQRTLCAEVEVNGIKAYTLFDTGCTTDAISPELAYLAKADRVDLKEQINLQLGTKGSRTTINYGALPRIRIGPIDGVNYMDVVDIDRYDVVLGTTFCNEHNVVLDFRKREIWIDGVAIPAYTAIQEAEVLGQRRDHRQNRLAAHLRAATTSRH
ncbi:uncharacterized protein C8Q71DRAFT_714326 [Rhodofomes roseus]|uniref:Peptidase A2 domain-containing protein n=1 Tax=Rhodofomes roseus TaxID=34475 RepID=A0ABQ8K597_9APHY|nr:uncharacterized protein C8Q71DRAFT_714326 [Rhodofomes roseus]KAH9832163.1 hypothetical protein C8Q71DRAFT_714326 [Rhodofomes roseus]